MKFHFFQDKNNLRIGLDAPQNRINKLADSISFKARQNQLNAIKNKLFDMNSQMIKGGENPKKDQFLNKVYISER